ncbi:HAMP domain-containing protein [Actinomadura luteofluorescens]|uniref:HAMP domain-containing protein n=1 Tax=Actinomadura luteofluorescens TaxID=46163 RepID=UPI0036442E93
MIAGMLVLVTLGMLVMSAAGASVLRQYLVGRADDQLRGSVGRAIDQVVPQLQSGQTRITVRIPSEMYGQVRTTDGRSLGQNPAWSESGHPRLPADLNKHVDRPFTVTGTGGSTWRILAEPIPGGAVIVLAFSLEEIDRTVQRLVVIDAIVGLAVLAVLAVVGVGVVRASLRPLAAVEETAGAIAAGDLSRRVPEADPGTEMGLARAVAEHDARADRGGVRGARGVGGGRTAL